MDDQTVSSQAQKTRGGLRFRGQEKRGEPDRPLVSLVTVVLNGEASLRPTIESVLQQSYVPIEYLVIDGGSTDGTLDILREYDGRIDYWCSESDQGISDAFNKGIAAARGEVIGLINAGDRYEPEAVAKVMDRFLADGGIGVVCGELQFWKRGQQEYRCPSVPDLLEREMTVAHPTCFVRTDLYRRFGAYSLEYRYAMDYELLLRLKTNGIRIVALNEVLANMEHDGLSEANWQQALAETHRARKTLLAPSFFTSRGYWLFLLFKRRIRVFLERLGWSGILRFYRGRLALVRKTKL